MTTTSLSPAKILYNDGSVSLLIRPLRKEDASTLNTAVQESLDNLLPFMDWAHSELSEKNQLDRIITSNQNHLQKFEYDFAVFDNSGNFVTVHIPPPSSEVCKKNDSQKSFSFFLIFVLLTYLAWIQK